MSEKKGFDDFDDIIKQEPGEVVIKGRIDRIVDHGDGELRHVYLACPELDDDFQEVEGSEMTLVKCVVRFEWELPNEGQWIGFGARWKETEEEFVVEKVMYCS